MSSAPNSSFILLFLVIIIIHSWVRLSPLGTAVTTGLLYQPQMMVILEQTVECIMEGEIEVLGENLP
jgi:hypothetical protein